MSTEWTVCDVGCEYEDNTDSQYEFYEDIPVTRSEKMEMSVEMLLVCAIYGLLFISLWGYSVMGGVKFNPHLTLMAIPVFGSVFIAAIIAIIQAMRKFIASKRLRKFIASRGF